MFSLKLTLWVIVYGGCSAGRKKGWIHLCSFSLSLSFFVSRAKSFCRLLVFLSSAARPRSTGQQVKSIIPLAVEIFVTIWNKCVVQVSLQAPLPSQFPEGRGQVTATYLRQSVIFHLSVACNSLFLLISKWKVAVIEWHVCMYLRCGLMWLYDWSET